MKVALITGITGQDGSYLAELLLDKGYQVWGLMRRTSTPNAIRIPSHALINPNLEFITGDMLDQTSLIRVIEAVQPDEVYNLAAQSYVPESWAQPLYTMEVNALGPMHLLEALRITGCPAKFYQASTSEMFGGASPPQSEMTPFYPRSPYGVSKAAAHWATVNYRESYDMFAVSGILFNHESPRRGYEFVTRKITRAVADISRGDLDVLHLGNLEAKRDWGFAGDYVRAMWMMLQQEEPEDWVIATGAAHSVEEFCDVAFGCAGLNWRDHVLTDDALLRPAEVHHLVGDPTKAARLGWEPEVSFQEMVEMMVDCDLAGA